MKDVLYVGFYDVLREGKQIRNYSLAAAKKMNFVSDAIAKLGFHVDIVSPSFIKVREHKRTGEVREKLNGHVDLVLTPSWGAKTKPERIARVLYSNFWLFAYLLRHAGKGKPVVVYHNHAYALPVIAAQKLKKFKLILEVEEQYSMVWKLSGYQKWKEDLLLKHGAESGLAVSELLADKLKMKNPIVSYGNYNAYQGEIPTKMNGEKKVLVYTGSVDRVKGSAFTAIEAMAYLPDHYELIVSGHVVEEDKKAFFSAIEEMNQRCGRTAVSYAGLLNDEDYEKLLLSADIALNPQKEGGFGQYLFPSKILTYMSYGLPVVSTKGASIVRSEVADLITFADDYTGEAVARAIRSVKAESAQVYLERLDLLKERFLKKLANVLDGQRL